MVFSHPLVRRVRGVLADQERALRAASLAESSHLATDEIRSLYRASAHMPDSAPADRTSEAPLIASAAVPQAAG